jgi:ATP phosphoribosyltransferase regulatory subunit
MNFESAAQALEQLRRLYEAIPNQSKADHLRLDLSMINDISYYNGVIFQGFVQGVPHCLLAGGQYDRLMERFGKQGGALGFALYLDELDRLEAAAPELDPDLLVEYDPEVTADQIAAVVEEYTAQGKTVLALPAPADSRLHFGQKIRLTQTKEVAKC